MKLKDLGPLDPAQTGYAAGQTGQRIRDKMEFMQRERIEARGH